MCPYCRSLFAALIAPGRIGKVATGAKRTFLPRPAGVGAPSRAIPCPIRGGRQCHASTMTTSLAFEVTSKRRKGFPSETRVKRGLRFVRGGEKELVEKLGRRDQIGRPPVRTPVTHAHLVCRLQLEKTNTQSLNRLT